MELVCNNCKFRRNLGNNVQADEVFICTECQSKNVSIVDSGGVVIKVDGINENTVVNVIKELASNISIYDIFKFLAKQDNDKDDQENK